MITLTAAELKRRGFAALDAQLLRGPVRITRHNRPAAVVLSETDYAALSGTPAVAESGMTALQWLLARSTNVSKGAGKADTKSGKQGKAQLDRRLHAERDSWA